MFCFNANRLQQPKIQRILHDLDWPCFDWQLGLTLVTVWCSVHCDFQLRSAVLCETHRSLWLQLNFLFSWNRVCAFYSCTCFWAFQSQNCWVRSYRNCCVMLIQDACWPAGASWLLPGNWHTHGSAHCEGGLARGQLWVTPWILQGHETYFYQLQELQHEQALTGKYSF